MLTQHVCVRRFWLLLAFFHDRCTFADMSDVPSAPLQLVETGMLCVVVSRSSCFPFLDRRRQSAVRNKKVLLCPIVLYYVHTTGAQCRNCMCTPEDVISNGTACTIPTGHQVQLFHVVIDISVIGRTAVGPVA